MGVAALAGCADPLPSARPLGADLYTVTASRFEGTDVATEAGLAAASRQCRGAQRDVSVVRIAVSENAVSNVAPSATVDFRCTASKAGAR